MTMRTLCISLTLLLYLATLAEAQNSNEGSKPGCLPCEQMLAVELPDVHIHVAEARAGNTPHCRIYGTIGNEIDFELMLPDQWNTRFVMGGGGGFSGSIQNGARWTLGEGYATVGTNTGHKGAGIKADWAYHQMERQVNFGHLAVHRTAVVAKALIKTFYCETPAYSYFMGCSRGGGQALIEAQRYPEDFDGILSYAPIIDWPATAAEGVQNLQALFPDPMQRDKARLSPGHLALLQAEVFAQCDGLDGVEDQILNDPRDCAFDFSKLPTCPEGQRGDACFTPQQIDIVRTIYAGPRSPQGPIYPGFPYGNEGAPNAWQAWITGPNPGSMQLGYPSLHYAFATEIFKYLVFQDSTWNYSTYDFEHYRQETAYAASYLNATRTDYGDFKAAGGKMIIYHGWSDPALSAYTTIDHYEEALRHDPELPSYIRFYLLPGVLHCGGGPGPDRGDWLGLIRAWVEEGLAPERMVVAKVEEGDTLMTRPLLPYPREVVYSGSGDPNDASNYVEKEE